MGVKESTFDPECSGKFCVERHGYEAQRRNVKARSVSKVAVVVYADRKAQRTI